MVLRADPVPEQVDKILQNLLIKVNVAAGVGANVNIAIAGIATTDKLVAVLMFEPDNGATGTMVTNKTSTASITSAGNIQSTDATTGKQVLVIWLDIT